MKTSITDSHRMRVRRGLLAWQALLACLLVFDLNLAFAQATTTTLVPNSYVTTRGSDGGQPVSSMDVRDESGIANNPNHYVEFQAQKAGVTYAGYRTYALPPSISSSSITALQVQVNYWGPAKARQTWTWRIYDWVHKAYMTIGDNSMAPDLGPWTLLSFNIAGRLAHYVRTNDRQIRLHLMSNNAADNVDIDYEAVVVTSKSNVPPAGSSFYVSTGGNDNAPGTLTQPWRTISHAASTVGPGSAVYVRGGVYNERVVFKVSGSASGGYITFQSYPGETAILDGTGVNMPASNGFPSGMFHIANRSYLIIAGFEIRNLKRSSSSLFPAGIAIIGTGSHIQIRNNRIHDISNGKYGAHGLAAYGTAAPASINNLIIDGNQLYNLTLGQSESMVLNGNVQFWSITNNVLHHNDNIGIDIIGFEGTSPVLAYDQARDGYIGGNLVYNISDNNNPAYPPNDNSADAIYVDGGTRITIERNILHHNNIGLELACEHQGRTTSYVTARSNLVYLNTGPGITIGGYSKTVGSTDHCAVVNNTLFMNDSLKTGSGEFQIQFFPTDGSVSNNIFENNILSANSQGLLINNPFSTPVVTVDYNLHFAPNGNPNNNTWVWKNKTYTSFSAYQLASANDSHSQFSNPQFLNTISTPPNLYVQPTSPGVNAGNNLGSSVAGTLDLAGTPRKQGANIDLGAYEQ